MFPLAPLNQGWSGLFRWPSGHLNLASDRGLITPGYEGSLGSPAELDVNPGLSGGNVTPANVRVTLSGGRVAQDPAKSRTWSCCCCQPCSNPVAETPGTAHHTLNRQRTTGSFFSPGSRLQRASVPKARMGDKHALPSFLTPRSTGISCFSSCTGRGLRSPEGPSLAITGCWWLGAHWGCHPERPRMGKEEAARPQGLAPSWRGVPSAVLSWSDSGVSQTRVWEGGVAGRTQPSSAQPCPSWQSSEQDLSQTHWPPRGTVPLPRDSTTV